VVKLYKPTMDDLCYRQSLIADKETMTYNEKWGGAIDWPCEKWSAWAKKWLNSEENRYFYRYIYDENRAEFVGEAAFRYDENYDMHVISIIVEAKHRGKGYGRAALSKLIQEAKHLGIKNLCDDIAADNPSISLFESMGFEEKWRTDEVVMLALNLKEK